MKNLFLPSVQNGYIYENAAEVVEEVIFLKNSLEENDDQFLKSVELEWKIKIFIYLFLFITLIFI